ncbi:hypothetical protein TRFO_11410 [Tritrichomonas foetus]|uniref:C2 NT-type domain-containing protein n=1 Tax=Tritrichomonas foetus TaxID=1144522 RepID=A0A1J4J638_9EUKA|nr:hypothetical protein TRFO_11410 [Tritrichomonas foetus]|eukprot:OHS94121.1 hypothetical protein TRFO_11410 [Tritrichomonas foetus]
MLKSLKIFMFSKWEKESCIVKFTVHTVDINRNLEDQFKLSWKRGKYKGATSRVIAMNSLLTFNEPFQCKVTIYKSKSDHTVRQKDITFVLSRIDQSNDEPKVYGKVKINLSEFYDKQTSTTYTVEMESKHLRKPKMTTSFHFKKSGQVSDINSDEMTETQDSTISIDKWDSTGSPNQSSVNFSAPNTIPFKKDEKDDKNDKNYSQLSKFQRSNSRKTKTMPVSPLMPSQNLIDFMGLKNREHIKLFDAVLKVAWPTPLTPSFIAIPYQYPPAVFPLFASFLKSRIFQKDEPLEENLFDIILDMMQKAPLSISCSNEKRFVTFLVLYVLINTECETYGLDKQRVKSFSEKFKLIVNKSLIAFGKPLLGRTEQFCSHFLGASFEVNELLGEFESNMKDVQNLLMLPAPIKSAVLNSFNAMMDVKLLTKMVSNPSLLTFKNAMIWSSFMTALESSSQSFHHNTNSNNNDTNHDNNNLNLNNPHHTNSQNQKTDKNEEEENTEYEGLDIRHSNNENNNNSYELLPLSSEASKILMMAPQIGKSPEIAKEVCPHLSPNIVLFLLVHVRPDEIMAEPIDASHFVEYYGMQADGGLGEITPNINQNYLDVASSIRVKDWCKCELQAEVVAKFPFFKEYLPASTDSSQ